MEKPDPGEDFWSLLKPYTGQITATRQAERGFSSDVTTLVDCESGRVFVKAGAGRPQAWITGPDSSWQSPKSAL
jgi:hypothetical protein